MQTSPTGRMGRSGTPVHTVLFPGGQVVEGSNPLSPTTVSPSSPRELVEVAVELCNANDPAAEQNPGPNGHRWRVSAIRLDNNCLAARRLADNTLAVFDGDYDREQITHGSAVTVHSAQGGHADTTHAVLGENTTRSMLYVAMTRGREPTAPTSTKRPLNRSMASTHRRARI
jgi:hypothetical protein